MKKDYIDLSGEHLALLRLLAEGASNLFETQAQPLFLLGMKAGEFAAVIAFAAMGAALSELCRHIRILQEARIQEGLHGLSDKSTPC